MSKRRATATRPLGVRALAAGAAVAVTASLAACAGPLTAHRAAPADGAPGGPVGPPAPYIVVLEDGAAAPAAVATQQADLGMGTEAEQVFSHALHGYTAELSAAEAALLRTDERVAHVEPDRVVDLAQITPSPQQVPTGVRRIFADENPVLDIDGQDDVRTDVDVAVIDSGIAEHSDLNVVARTDCTASATCVDGTSVDDIGHGTHVAGTIAAIDDGDHVVGVAPGARLHAIKVCGTGGQCLLSAMLAAIDYVTARADVIEVANMSLAGPGTSAALDQAIAASVDAGVVHVVAAGNSGLDVAGYFPGNSPDAITVSAVADGDGEAGGLAGSLPCRPASRDDALADFSNFGPAVDIAAPGVCIVSTSNDGGLRSMSGTSMAAPHVAGAAAVLASGVNDPTTRDAVLAIRQQLLDGGNLGWVDDSGDGVQEPLLDVSRLGNAPDTGPTPDPGAGITPDPG